MDITKLILCFSIAFGVSLISTPYIKVLAQKIGAIDVPDARRVHDHPIPRMGGLAIFYGFLIAILCFAKVNTELRGILIGSLVIIALGIIDDVKQLGAKIKLAVQIFVAIIVVSHGVVIRYISMPSFLVEGGILSLGGFAIPITILWIVGVTNAINLIDGLDGLAAGISIISTIPLLVISVLTGEVGVAFVTAAIAGAGFGFLPHNIHPAKIFMGDTGSTFLGFTIASISIVGLFKSYAVFSVAVPFLMLGLPIFDTLFAIIRRLLRGQSPMHPDRGHVHHRLIDFGFDQKKTVIILLIASSLLSLSALLLWMCGVTRAIILILAVLFLSFLGISLAKNNKTNDENLDFTEETESEIKENEEN